MAAALATAEADNAGVGLTTRSPDGAMGHASGTCAPERSNKRDRSLQRVRVTCPL